MNRRITFCKIIWGGVTFLVILLLYVKFVEEINQVVVNAKYMFYEVLSQDPKELLLERSPLTEQEEEEWQSYRFSAHAGGDVDGIKYTNSIEAISTSISEGFFLINVDVSQTSDGQFALIHDWKENADAMMPIGLDELNDRLMYETFHFCTLYDLLDIMNDNDIWVIVDAKCVKDPVSFAAFYDSFSQAVWEYDPNLFSRFIVEVCSAETYEALAQMNYPYHYIYFPTSTDSREIYENALFCLDNGINAMLLDSSVENEVISVLAEKGFKLYLYNINTIYEAKDKAAWGAWGFQTDYLSPKWTEYIFNP